MQQSVLQANVCVLSFASSYSCCAFTLQTSCGMMHAWSCNATSHMKLKRYVLDGTVPGFVDGNWTTPELAMKYEQGRAVYICCGSWFYPVRVLVTPCVCLHQQSIGVMIRILFVSPSLQVPLLLT